MKTYLVFILSLIICSSFSCSTNIKGISKNHELLVEISKTEVPLISKSYVEENNICPYFTLEILLKSKVNENLLFDRNAFKSEIVRNNKMPLIKQIKLLNESTVLVENTMGDIKFLRDSTYKYLLYSSRIPHLENRCMFSCKKKVLTVSNDDQIVFSDIEVCLEDLKINKEDTKFRVYYIFIPTKQEIKEGYKPKIIKSNWIDIID